jgi:hypothetical protein
MSYVAKIVIVGVSPGHDSSADLDFAWRASNAVLRILMCSTNNTSKPINFLLLIQNSSMCMQKYFHETFSFHFRLVLFLTEYAR